MPELRARSAGRARRIAVTALSALLAATTFVISSGAPAPAATSDLVLVDAYGQVVTRFVDGQVGYVATFPAPQACPQNLDADPPIIYGLVHVIVQPFGPSFLATVDLDSGAWSAEGNVPSGSSFTWQCEDDNNGSPTVVLGSATPAVDPKPTFTAPTAGNVGATITVSAVGACHASETVRVDMSSGFETDPTSAAQFTVPGNGLWSTQLTVPALGAGKTTESIRASCFDTTGTTQYAQSYGGRTFTPASSASAPGAPTGVTAKPGSTSASTGPIVVSYRTPSNHGAAITKYTATCSSSNRGVTVTGVHSGATAAPITVVGATLKKTYTCKVKATNSQGTGPASAASNSVIVGAPAQVSKPSVSKITPGKLKVKFTNLSGAQTHGSPLTTPKYTAACKSSNGGTTKAATGTKSPIDVTGLKAGKKYTCAVKAHNARGYGQSSDPSKTVTA